MANRFEKQLVKIKQNRKVFAMMLFAMMAVFMWVFISLAFSQKKVKIDNSLIEKAKPLVPYLDEEVLYEIEAKREFEETELYNFKIYRILEDEEQDHELFLEAFDRDSTDTFKPQPTLTPTLIPESGDTLQATESAQDYQAEDRAIIDEGLF